MLSQQKSCNFLNKQANKQNKTKHCEVKKIPKTAIELVFIEHVLLDMGPGF